MSFYRKPRRLAKCWLLSPALESPGQCRGLSNNAKQCFMTTFCSKLDIIIDSSERIRGIWNKKDHHKKLKFTQHFYFMRDKKKKSQYKNNIHELNHIQTHLKQNFFLDTTPPPPLYLKVWMWHCLWFDGGKGKRWRK